MTSRAFLRTCLLTGSVFLSSCAYMQTHKNIEESFSQHAGYQLSPDFQLFKAGKSYYLTIDRMSLKKTYPVIHDSIFLKDNNAPSLEPIAGTSATAYKEISAGTATVLQQNSGYADLSVLKDELNSSDTPWLDALPAGAVNCRIRAEIVGQAITWTDENASATTPTAIKILSTFDQLCIDWPGTVLYNVAIPVMAPFVFFHEFLNEHES